MNNIEQQIEIVKKEILDKFPNASHTIRILIWDDNTTSVECSHTDNNLKRHVSKIYNGVLSYEEIENNGKVMVLNEFGQEEYYKLVKDE